ncbi:hypothetical protein P5V15_013501 [Pogonomyrmex californicus]
MFYLDGGDAAVAAKYDSSSSLNEEENFGWWLGDREIPLSPRSRIRMIRDHRSPDSFASTLSCLDSDDSDSCSFARDVSRHEQESGICEKIELISFGDDLDIDPIEGDAGDRNSLPATISSEINEECINPSASVCYTPERLIRSQEYRILTPSPRRYVCSQARFTPENEGREWRSRRCRKRLNRLIDSKQIGATQLRILLNLPSTDTKTSMPVFDCRRQDATNDSNTIGLNDDLLTHRDCSVRNNGKSGYDQLNSTWDDCKDPVTQLSSLEDTSGIQSYDWSLETQSDAQNTPMCLCDELAIASRDHANLANNRSTTIIEAASILESLRGDPGRATALLEEDRFCDSTSSHDQLTRLALAIETDVEAPAVPDDSNNWIRHLRDRIARLQLANKEIHGDIRGLRINFQCDEKKAINLSSDTTRLLEDVHDLRYFDDLLKLLEGELERISRRNWPFILGHTRSHEEMNLII